LRLTTLGVVETKLTASVALTPLAEADSVAGPALVAQIITVALPFPSVVAVDVLNVPRVDAKLTEAPVTAALLDFQLTVTGTFGVHVVVAAIGIKASAAGAENWNCWLLTKTLTDAEAPADVTVTVSVAVLVAVTVNVACPAESVVSVAALRVLPALDVTVTGCEGIAFFAASVSEIP